MSIKIDPECRYSKTHEWVRIEGDQAFVGISDYAQQQLSDVVYVEVPEVGDTFSAGEVFGVVESVKAASDVYLPLGGEILEVNVELADSPDLVNKDPYGDGWFVKITIDDPDEANQLLSADEYEVLAKKAQAEGGH